MKFCFLLIFISTTVSVFSQTNSADTTKMTYILNGDGCPVCNDKHPEESFGFFIKCEGCRQTPEIEAQNKLVIQALDKKYGQGWTEKYLQYYCDKFPIRTDKKQVILKQK